MRKLTLLNLAGVAVVAAGIFAVSSTAAKPSATKIIKTSDLPASEVVHFPESQLYQKPGAPIRYSYSMPRNIEIGQVITFDLRLSEPFNSGDLRVSSATRGDVSLLSNSGNNDFSMSGDNGHDMGVTFVANSPGRHYLQFQAVSNSPQGTRFRAFSIPVQVGPKQAPPQHPGLTQTPDGEMVISMKATEEIR